MHVTEAPAPAQAASLPRNEGLSATPARRIDRSPAPRLACRHRRKQAADGNQGTRWIWQDVARAHVAQRARDERRAGRLAIARHGGRRTRPILPSSRAGIAQRLRQRRRLSDRPDRRSVARAREFGRIDADQRAVEVDDEVYLFIDDYHLISMPAFTMRCRCSSRTRRRRCMWWFAREPIPRFLWPSCEPATNCWKSTRRHLRFNFDETRRFVEHECPGKLRHHRRQVAVRDHRRLGCGAAHFRLGAGAGRSQPGWRPSAPTGASRPFADYLEDILQVLADRDGRVHVAYGDTRSSDRVAV